MQLTDSVTLDGVRQTGDGYLVANAKVARTGIQLYSGAEVGKPDMPVVRVYRSPEQVFAADSRHSLAHKPLTNDHPGEMVNADTWKRNSIGQIGGEVSHDTKFLYVPLAMMDAQAIRDWKGGKRELSAGYTCDLKWEPGKTPDGEAYDAFQENIRFNHVALVDAARGGRNLRIGDSGDLNMRTNTTDQFFRDHAREELVYSAVAVAGRLFATDGLSDAQIRRTSVALRLGDVAVAGQSDDYVLGQFESFSGTGVTDASIALEKARAEYRDRLSNAWRGKDNPAPAADTITANDSPERLATAAEAARAAYRHRVSNAWRNRP